MPQRREAFGWARGLGGGVVRLGVALAVLLAVTVALFVFFLRDTPPVAAAVHHETSGMDALLSASLVMSRDCITVQADAQTWVPIFPYDAVRLRHDALLYAGGEYRTGDRLDLAGGEVSAPPAGARIPPACAEVRGSFWVVAP